MRLSVRREDPGYDLRAFRSRVLLDGKDITARCVTADDARGEVLCFIVGDDNRFMVDRKAGALKTEVLHGKVQILNMDTGVAWPD